MFAKSLAVAAIAAVAVASPTSPPSYSSSKNSTKSLRPKVILDNDWGTTGFIPILQALKANWDVIGVVSDTANSWALQCGLHALATLEVGNLSCIPVYKGSDYPILNTPELFQTWELVHGELPWQGAFAPENLTNEALGNDPTSGDPNRISKAALFEGYPNTTFASTTLSAAEFMVQQVRKYPGEITIYSAGALTNVALAVRLDSTFAQNTRGLIIMGGYLDVNLLMTTGSVLLADLQSDINLIIDPEGSKIALNANFPNITITGNVANQVMSDQAFLDEIHTVKNVYTDLVYKYYGTIFPFWDETAAAIMVDRNIVTNSTDFYIDVDTSYASPSYGNIRAYQKALAPKAQNLKKVKYPLSIDGAALKSQIKASLQYPPQVCAKHS
jgi:inosine-uridine nucleoside N-ribohydrolase